MSRFLFEDDDRERDLIGGTVQQEQLIYMTANEVHLHCGCARCGRRLVNSGRPHAGAKVTYPAGKSKRSAIGTPLCGCCQAKLQ